MDGVMPQVPQLEKAVLGAMINDNTCIVEVSHVLSSDDFYRTEHKEVYTAILDLWEHDKPVDVIVLRELIKTDPIDYAEASVSSANILYHAKVIHEKAMLRQVITGCQNIVKQAYLGEALDDVAESLERVRVSSFPDEKEHSFSEILHETNAEIDQRRTGHVVSRMSGLWTLDDLTGGFEAGELVVIAGGTSHGKTALALQVAVHVVASQQVPVLIFELEMPRTQLASRIIAQMAEVNLFRYRLGKLTEEEWKRVNYTLNKTANYPFLIDDTAGVSLPYIRRKAMLKKMRANIGMVIVDYLQLVNMPDADRHDLKVGAVTIGLKNLAKELGVPVILLSQLSREHAKEKREPILADLRDSGNIEQDADKVIFTHRPFKDDAPDSTEARLLLLKNRNGPCGKLDARFNKDWVGFYE